MSKLKSTIKNKRNISNDTIVNEKLNKQTKSSQNDIDEENDSFTSDDSFDSNEDYVTTDDDALSVTKIKKIYKNVQKYRKEWENDPSFKGWLKADKNDEVGKN